MTARRAALVALIALAAAPLVLGTYGATTMARMLAFALLAASADLLVGTTGLPTLGHGAYFGAGAYAAGWIALHVTPSAPVTLAAAAGVSAVVAAVAGSVAVRARGVYFLMLTLAIGEIVEQLAQSWHSVTGGSDGLYGIPATRLAGVPLTDAAAYAWYALGVFVAGMAVLRAIARAPLGATLRGIRDNEARMRALGYRTYLYKLAAFAIAGSLAGVAGALLAGQQRLVTPADLGFTASAPVLLAVIIGGEATAWGPCLGAAIVVALRDVLGPGLGGHGALVLGAVFVAVVFAMPGGLARLGGRLGGRRNAMTAGGGTR
ncbi:MAG TPA: branched-chain amino acid ABC transporter permease [Kofleriaceae bacterium]|jgi:branched-chain amino acid transport system permease protein|nr:branched-chain amino acid ABC transporter permease [Kofleriaceae bacterium]